MNQQIGEAIRTAGQDRKLTQEEFAARLGVTPQAVSKWERSSGLIPCIAAGLKTDYVNKCRRESATLRSRNICGKLCAGRETFAI